MLGCEAGVVNRGVLLRSKVKLICFVDTLMTLTSVNIKPALFFSLLELNPAVGTIHHADHT